VNAKALADVSELKLGAETTLQQRTEADQHHEAVASLKAHESELETELAAKADVTMALWPEIDELRTEVESASAAKESLAGEENELRVSLESAEADAAEAVRADLESRCGGLQETAELMHASLIASEALAGSSRQELDRLRSELERMESYMTGMIVGRMCT
jgi:chromosome segregation ATPase